MLIKNGVPLIDLEDWEKRAGPKHSSQWKRGRSAMEVARAWLDAAPAGLPNEVQAALMTNASFGPILHWEAEPEVRLSLDDRRGEPRNTDLLVIAHDAAGPFVVAVEAKADESFDRQYAVVLQEALEARLTNANSGALDRAIDLARALLQPHRTGQPELGVLRYQLFTAAVGALREAERRKITRAVLLIHEFETDATADVNHKRNASDLNAWVSRLSSGVHQAVQSGEVVGPVSVPGAPLLNGSATLYIGKAVRHLRESSC